MTTVEEPQADEHAELWLTPGQLASWLSVVRLITRLPWAIDAQLQREADLSMIEYMTMAMLSEAPDWTLRMSELAEVTSGSLPRLSQVVTKLEDRGWVQRRPDPKDGRATLAVLTKAGFKKLEESAPAHVDTVRRLVFDPLTHTQVRQLFDIHQRIKGALDPSGSSITARVLENRRSLVEKRKR